MQICTCRSWFFAVVGFVAIALLSGCGGSNTPAIPATTTVFYAHTVFKNSGSSTSPDSLYTMGYNAFGQLGDGTLTTRATAGHVTGLQNLQIVTINGAVGGGDHSLAFGNLSTVGNRSVVLAWGSNYHGQLGNTAIATAGTSAYSSTPVRVVGIPGNVTAVAAGGYHSLAVADGKVYAWGYNAYHQLGNVNPSNVNPNLLPADSATPLIVKESVNDVELSGVTQVAAGGTHSLALKADGTVYAWGNNQFGQVGLDPRQPAHATASGAGLVGTLAHITQIAAGGSNSYALETDSDGNQTVWGWGYNNMGQLGIDPTSTTNPNQVHDASGNSYSYIPCIIATSTTLKSNIVKISAGSDHLLILLANKEVRAIGFNDFGQLGDNTITSRSSLVTVLMGGTAVLESGSAMKDATDILAFGHHSLAQVNGVWYGWGDNGSGELGNPISTTSIGYLTVPQPIQFQ